MYCVHAHNCAAPATRPHTFFLLCLTLYRLRCRLQKLAAVNRQLAAHQDTLRQGLAAMQQQQDRTTAAVHDGVAAAAADAKTVSSVSRALESKVKDQVAAVQRQVLEHHDEYQRQLASVTAAIRAFADVMHVTPPLSALR